MRQLLDPEPSEMGINPLGACILPMVDYAFVSQPLSVGASTTYALLPLHLDIHFCFMCLPFPFENPYLGGILHTSQPSFVDENINCEIYSLGFSCDGKTET